MKSTSIMAAIAACTLMLAPSLAAKPAKPAPHRAAAVPAGTLTVAPSVLPEDMSMLNAGAPAHAKPLSTTKAAACPTVTNPTWAVSGGAQLCGIQSQYNANVTLYPGIQYATANRWQAPVANRLSSQNLTGFGPECPQVKAGSVLPNENCLYLNVWVPPGPAPAGGFPVMVFIHGGAFVTGAGSLPVYDGTSFAANNVILVTLNYRLGPLGFLVSTNNSYGVNAGGNYGIMDQQMALHWVSDNIDVFGGNASKITIFGESAGAMSVGLHLRSIPSSASFFGAAIMESNPVGLRYRKATDPGPSVIGGQFLNALCSAVTQQGGSCAKGALADPTKTSTAQILTAATGMLTEANLIVDIPAGFFGIDGLPWQPVIDGKLIQGQPFQGYAPGMKAKPVLFGRNQDEGAVFAALVATALAAKTSTAANTQPSTLYYTAVVDGSFGLGATKKLAKANLRYNTSGKNPSNYDPSDIFYNQNGQAAANIVTDYDFAIGNIVMSNQTAANQAPMYAYYFTQAPLWDIYGKVDNGACAPGGGNFVCHGAELPYVFNTLANVAPEPPPPANLDLAAAMNAAWVAFAVNPASPGSVWSNAYSNIRSANTTGTPALILNASLPTTPTTGPIDPYGVYSVWQSRFSSTSAAAPGHRAGHKPPAKK